MRCPNCNNEFSDVNARFCPFCGYLVQSTQTNSFTYNSNSNSANNGWYSNQQNMYSTPQNNGTNGELLVKIGGFILAVIYLFAGFSRKMELHFLCGSFLALCFAVSVHSLL